jgi:hypothetical protein
MDSRLRGLDRETWAKTLEEDSGSATGRGLARRQVQFRGNLPRHQNRSQEDGNERIQGCFHVAPLSEVEDGRLVEDPRCILALTVRDSKQAHFPLLINKGFLAQS